MPISFRNLYYTYYPKSPYEYTALKGINLTLEDKRFIAIVGHTGSGKSTLVQHINALLLPTEGEVEVNEYKITPNAKIKGLKLLRKHAGMVFQFPEYQLFEETVFKDIAFGPKNFGANEEELKPKIIEIMKMVGLDESFLERSPFELSGGQKRRVAIAGILAMEPDILILDEPTAGLDPQGAHDMMRLFRRIYQNGTTIIMVTHEMEYVLGYCEEVVVLKDGQVVAQKRPIDIFTNDQLLKDVNIEPPMVISFAKKLEEKGLKIDWEMIKNTTTLVDAIAKAKGVSTK